MQITSLKIAKLSIPLIRPFITAIRQTNQVEDIVVMIETNCGAIGYGSAAATPLITGDSQESIIGVIQTILAPQLIGKDVSNFNQLLYLVQTCLAKNTSAKAAVDIALHDLFAKLCNLPLYQLLGGNNNCIPTCITISVKEATEMAEDAKLLVAQGFTSLKIKLGLNPKQDLERIKAIRHMVGNEITILIDANQGWQTKQAIQVIKAMEQNDLQVEVIEQPVKAEDLASLKYVRDNVSSVIFADESCNSPFDALKIAQQQISDGINIKLMKAGGLSLANTIYQIATSANLPCMLGSMLESPIGIAAMASFAASKPNITYIDLDALALIKHNPIMGGANLVNNNIILSKQPGLGIEGFKNNFNLISKIQ